MTGDDATVRSDMRGRFIRIIFSINAILAVCCHLRADETEIRLGAESTCRPMVAQLDPTPKAFEEIAPIVVFEVAGELLWYDKHSKGKKIQDPLLIDILKRAATLDANSSLPAYDMKDAAFSDFRTLIALLVHESPFQIRRRLSAMAHEDMASVDLPSRYERTESIYKKPDRREGPAVVTDFLSTRSMVRGLELIHPAQRLEAIYNTQWPALHPDEIVQMLLTLGMDDQPKAANHLLGYAFTTNVTIDLGQSPYPHRLESYTNRMFRSLRDTFRESPSLFSPHRRPLTGLQKLMWGSLIGVSAVAASVGLWTTYPDSTSVETESAEISPEENKTAESKTP